MELNSKKARAYAENILALYENGNISIPSVYVAMDFCQKCKIGSYNCCVKTMYGWCCDICLEDELLYLNSLGIATINSCCGHGNISLASILTVSNESAEKMRNAGYSLADNINRKTDYGKPIHSWKPKSALLYELYTNTSFLYGDFADRLASYEDTGLTPEEIIAIKADNKRLHELIDILEGAIKAL